LSVLADVYLTIQKYKYPFKSTEEAEEYFLGKNPKKHKDYKYFKGSK